MASIAFPAILTGIYGFRADQAAEIAVTEFRAGLANDENLEEVILVAFDQADFQSLERAAGP